MRIDRREINYISLTLESYDGMAVVKTIDPEDAVIEICISPGCEDLVFDILESLKKNEKIEMNSCLIRGSQ